MALKKIISGGQTGVDQAALDVAISFDIPHGGWIPKGRRTEAGKLPDKYMLKEMPTSSYHKRTEQNIIDSDGTLIISHGKLTGGSLLTSLMARKHKKELLHIDLEINRGFSAAQLIQSWIVLNGIKVLNVAGPRASEDPYIYENAVRLLKAVNYLFFLDLKNFSIDNLKPFYPRTVEDAVDRLLSELSLKAKTHIAKLEIYELGMLHPTLLEHIKDSYGLKFKTGELMKDCRFMAKGKEIDQDVAAELIIREMWKKLRETHTLRVVK
jgi:Circularly permutated YpsA SLOG family